MMEVQLPVSSSAAVTSPSLHQDRLAHSDFSDFSRDSAAAEGDRLPADLTTKPTKTAATTRVPTEVVDDVVEKEEETEESEHGDLDSEHGDLDSTGDSDRLVIAEDTMDSDTETEDAETVSTQHHQQQQRQQQQQKQQQQKDTQQVRLQQQAEIKPGEKRELVLDTREEGITTQRGPAVMTSSQSVVENCPAAPQPAHPDIHTHAAPEGEESSSTVGEEHVSHALLSEPERAALRLKDQSSQPEVQPEVQRSSPVVMETESERKALSDTQDVDSQSNASTDSARDQAMAADKKRRRRKPIKVTRHEPVSEQDFNKDKFDSNFNSLEMVAPLEAPPKKDTRLVSSFVAQAMKLWYDEEVPRILQSSPSKDTRPTMTRGKEPEKNTNPPREEKRVDMEKKVENRKEIRSGVAPDDQYYSTPSPATPDSRSTTSSRVQDFWTPGKCYIPSDNARSGVVGMERSLTPDNTPVESPLIAKAMQSVSSLSPASSSSMLSDQESPSGGATSGKRYVCNLCNKSFTFRTNLTRHQRAFHGRPCRRRTHDTGTGDNGTERVPSVGSEEPLDRSDCPDDRLSSSSSSSSQQQQQQQQQTPKSEPHMDPNYGRFSPSVVSDAKAGRFSPSMPSPSASSNEQLAVSSSPFAPYGAAPPGQGFVVIAPQEPVSCSLCLTTFEHQSELNRHEPTCRGIDRSKLQSDSFGAIDLSKPKVEPSENSESDSTRSTTYKPKFHYNMADMMKSGSATVPPAMEAPMTPPFLPNPGALPTMPLLPQHIAAANSGLLPHQLTSGLPLPFSPNGPGKRPYRCTLCTKKYSSFTSLAKHVGFVHKINLMAMHQQQQLEKESMAAMLTMANAEMRMLVEHDQSGINLSTSDAGIGRFPCKVCGQAFSFAANLRTHYLTVHPGVKDLVTAGRESPSPDTAGRTKTKSSEWVCDICRQNFASKRNLSRHLSHVHKVDPKRDSLSQTQGEQKPSVLNIPTYPLPSSLPRAAEPPKDTTQGIALLQDVIDRVVTADVGGGLNQGSKPPQVPSPTPPPPTTTMPTTTTVTREHPVKLPPKKAIMEEYQKEAEMKLRLEREERERLEQQRASSPALSEGSSGVLNLSQSNKSNQSVSSSKGGDMDLTCSETMAKDFEPVDLSGDSKFQHPLVASAETKRDFYPNPFSAILNLSQTYLRKLLNETPVGPSPATPPPLQHPADMYSTATVKDKENSINSADRYSRSHGQKSSVYNVGRDYSPDTASRLRDMLSSKGVGSNGYHSDNSRPSSRNNSLPPSGRSTPVDGLMDRRPLINSENNQVMDTSSLSDISPLRTNTANMMALKLKLMDQNPGIMAPEWKSKNSHPKKRKNSDFSMQDLVGKDKSGEEPHAKKARESIGYGENMDQAGKLPNVESIKTGDFPAIAIGKRHICGLCGASFTFQTNLTRHQRKLHGKPFVRKSSLNQNSKSENMAVDEKVPLSMVPPLNNTPFTSLPLTKQEATLIKQE